VRQAAWLCAACHDCMREATHCGRHTRKP
jgi:hypothetical protein